MGTQDEKAIAIVPQQPRAMVSYRQQYDEEALDIIRANKCAGATDGEFAGLMTIAAMKNLNPLTGQIHFVKRRTWNSSTQEYDEKWVPQVGIDGFRLQAARTREYDGQDEPEFTYAEGDTERRLPISCRIRVYRKGASHAFPSVVHFAEYVQTYFDKKKGKQVPNGMWASKPHIMLAKVAEALALRKAFPEELGDLHIREEFDANQEPEADRAGDRVVHGTVTAPTQAALPAPAAPTDDELLKRIAAADTEGALDDLAPTLNDVRESGRRKALKAAFDEKYRAVRAAARQMKQACPECKLLGMHAESCSKFEPPISPDDPDAEREV